MSANSMSASSGKAIFDRFDVDGTGHIDVNELQAMSEAMGRTLTAEESAAALKLLDKKGDGVISYEEFMEWVQHVTHRGQILLR